MYNIWQDTRTEHVHLLHENDSRNPLYNIVCDHLGCIEDDEYIALGIQPNSPTDTQV